MPMAFVIREGTPMTRMSLTPMPSPPRFEITLEAFGFLVPLGFAILLIICCLLISTPLWAASATATNGGAMGASTGLGGPTGTGPNATTVTGAANLNVSSPAGSVSTNGNVNGNVGTGLNVGSSVNTTASPNTNPPSFNSFNQNMGVSGTANPPPLAGNPNPYAQPTAQPNCANGLSSANCGSTSATTTTQTNSTVSPP